MAAAPRRVWPHLEPYLPISRTAAPAGLVTMGAGFFLGVDGFLKFAFRMADANNTEMLRQFSSGSANNAAAFVPYDISVITLYIFLFSTPVGLIASYLVASGLLRAVSAYVDDARGDPLLSGLHWAATALIEKNRAERRQISRVRREGAEVRDVLVTGDSLGVSADLVVLASRRKAEWTSGATVMTRDQWYRLAEPFDLETPAGLRTAYPLTKFDTVEVVRRGIEYELPALSVRAGRAPRRST